MLGWALEHRNWTHKSFRKSTTCTAAVARWALFVARLEANLRAGAAYDAKAWRLECLNFTLSWARGDQQFPVEPAGDSVAISVRLYAKYEKAVALGGPPLIF